MSKQTVTNIVAIVTLLLAFPTRSFSMSTYEQCLLKTVSEAPEEQTVKEIRQNCLGEMEKSVDEGDEAEEVSPSPLKQRRRIESIAQKFPFLLVPHKRNYVLPITYNESPSGRFFREEGFEPDRAEVKFQFSLKSRVAKGLFYGHGDLWLAYTNLSFWQAYNERNSSPFRETNHEPELFIDFEPSLELGPWKNNLIRIGAVHQSNGRSGINSRSWNRLYGTFLLENKNWFFGLRSWYRIPESEKTDDSDSGGDDNPDIHKFLGYGELLAFYRGENNRLGLTFRHNLRDDNKIALQLDWSYPISEHTRVYLQYFNGYGESLIDYNDSISRIGVGLLFSEAL